jgi:hypothetical protein
MTKLSGRDVVDFLSGENSVRDGRLIGLSLRRGQNEWEVTLHLTFDVPHGTRGSNYELVLWENLSFDYEFCSMHTLQQIAFVKCLWTDEGSFYLSLDPWMESEHLPSERDNDCFRSGSVSLAVSGNGK